MFKTPQSLFGWFKKVEGSKKEPHSIGDTSDDSNQLIVPSIHNKHQLINISISDKTEDFVGIDYRQLTYAEVAALLKQQEEVPIVKSTTKTAIKKRSVPDLSDSVEEISFKSGVKYEKSRNYKGKQREFIGRKKQVKRDEKSRLANS